MKTITFECKPRLIINKTFGTTTVMLNPRQKWTCTIENNIYKTVRNCIILKLSYTEFYELFKEMEKRWWYMIKLISTCNKNTLCVDCTSTTCSHAGEISADCPKYKCDNEIPLDCENCQWIKDYINITRNELRKQQWFWKEYLHEQKIYYQNIYYYNNNNNNYPYH